MTKKRRDIKTLYKWIWHSYLKTAIIPLILVELVFISIYFLTNSWSQDEMVSTMKTQVTHELESEATLQANNISMQVQGVAHAATTYAKQVARVLNEPAEFSQEDKARLAYSPEGVYYTQEDTKTGSVAVFASGYVPIGEAEQQKIARLLRNKDIMMDILNSEPLVASIYMNTHESINVIYPYFDVISQYTPHMDIPSYNFYYEADAQYNPEKTVQWTDAYLDPAGHGWMASAITPVYNGDFLEGVVGLDVTINTFVDQVLEMEIPWEGYGVLVGEDGSILALPAAGEVEWGLSELTDHSYDQAIMEDTFKPDQFNVYKRADLKEFGEKLSATENGIATLNISGTDDLISWSTIPETGWKFLIIVPETNVYERVNNMADRLFGIGSLMIGGLLCFYVVFFYVLSIKARGMSQNISKPLVEINEMVKKIGHGDYYQTEPVMPVLELKETGQYLREMGQELGDTNIHLLQVQNQLRNAEADLKSVLASVDDILFEMDENGYILNIWSKDQSLMISGYDEEKSNNVFEILDESSLVTVKKSISSIKEGKPSDISELLLDTNTGQRWFMIRVSPIESQTDIYLISARDIADRKEMENNLIHAKDEAEKANKAKSQFLSSMSHELRTPLNAILGFSQILEMDHNSPLDENQTESVSEIIKAGKHLLTLINEVLDLSRIESGKMNISIEPVPIRNIMEDTNSLIKPYAEQNGITLRSDYADLDGRFVMADYTRLKQIIINLISNAVKYNREDGNILFTCQREDDSIVFSVHDDGIGISKDNLEIIFKPFHRLENTTVKPIEGTGIGLTVSKQLIELMHGTIGVESEKGVGSRFYISLPIYKEKHPAAVQTSPVSINLGYRDPFTLLYVEDNPANLNLVERVVMNLPNVKLLSAVLGEVSIELAKAHRPDLIMLDINLPGIDGYEVYNRMKQHDELSDIPIIAISANATEKDIKKGLAHGFREYMTKPIDIPMFIDKINELRYEKENRQASSNENENI